MRAASEVMQEVEMQGMGYGGSIISPASENAAGDDPLTLSLL